MRNFVSLVLAGALASACSDPELAGKVVDLEARLAKLEAGAPAPGAAKPVAKRKQCRWRFRGGGKYGLAGSVCRRGRRR